MTLDPVDVDPSYLRIGQFCKYHLKKYSRRRLFAGLNTVTLQQKSLGQRLCCSGQRDFYGAFKNVFKTEIIC